MENIPERIRQEWSRDEISVLVLASLLLQIVLIVFSLFRKRQASYLLSILLWFSYLGADYVAVLALGKLLNKQNAALGEKSTGDLAAFWGPFLLLHLGGPDTITSYSLEDNQLWLRHLLGMLLQVSIAIFVFLKSLPSPHLWQAAIVVFTAGILKYGERTWSLRSASMLRESLLVQPIEYIKAIFSRNRNEENKCPNIGGHTVKNDEEIIKSAHSFFQMFLDISAMHNYYRDWRSCQDLLISADFKQVFQVVEIELSLLHDTLHTKAAHVHNVKGRTMRFLSLTMAVLSLVLFYRANKEDFKPGEIRITYILLIAALVIDIIAIVLLVLSNWTIIALQQSDRWKKFGRLIVKIIVKIRRFFLGKIAMRRWSNSMKQYNLIRLCLRNYGWKRRTDECDKWKNKWYGCLRETWDGWFHTNQQTVSDDLKDLIFNEMKDKLNEAQDSKYINYERLCESRGEWVPLRKGYTDLNWSVEKEFDESILVWHIATHLCYIEDQPAALPCTIMQEDKAKLLRRRLKISRKISEYMMFLLRFKPSMQPVGIGIGKFRYQDTCKQTMSLLSIFFDKDADISKAEGLELAQERNANSIGYKDMLRAIGSKLMEILKRKEPNLNSPEQTKEKAACDILLSAEDWFERVVYKSKSQERVEDKSEGMSVLWSACMLAQRLQKYFKDRREEKWDVISAVWVEMLCYAAGRCGTEAHAKQLSHGGELLTHVWLIMLHMGIALQVDYVEFSMGV